MNNDNSASSCLGCKERHLGCHTDCELYRQFKQTLQEKADKKAKYHERHPNTKIYKKHR